MFFFIDFFIGFEVKIVSKVWFFKFLRSLIVKSIHFWVLRSTFSSFEVKNLSKVWFFKVFKLINCQ